MQDPFDCVEDMHLSDAYTVMLGDNVSPYREDDKAAKRAQKAQQLATTQAKLSLDQTLATSATFEPCINKKIMNSVAMAQWEARPRQYRSEVCPSAQEERHLRDGLGQPETGTIFEEKEAQYVITNSALAARRICVYPSIDEPFGGEGTRQDCALAWNDLPTEAKLGQLNMDRRAACLEVGIWERAAETEWTREVTDFKRRWGSNRSAEGTAQVGE
ncbi:hypothetical protein CTAM01_06039 [Colletotrichum tamarilloi]|uniref:Uncharacterized protein n=1 Tax=Colletotrichum tamarilloi TaxID=1209934 RepID=A0ABQ9RCW5_9PEZI|nr:uncharacterized protein CTAM01_06039 [Colletotrichum tamarilloi]KAK1501314.1 hypothetical protein CTAM01_06039 [Colletotrichum tamarilloi]